MGKAENNTTTSAETHKPKIRQKQKAQIQGSVISRSAGIKYGD